MKVIIIYGSANDKEFMKVGKDYLTAQEVPFVEEVLSAHRNLPELIEYLDALPAICQVPGQVPLGTVGLHSKAPLNAGMYAHRILKLAGFGH